MCSITLLPKRFISSLRMFIPQKWLSQSFYDVTNVHLSLHHTSRCTGPRKFSFLMIKICMRYPEKPLGILWLPSSVKFLDLLFSGPLCQCTCSTYASTYIHLNCSTQYSGYTTSEYAACHLLSRRFLAWLILRRWRWKKHVHPKRPLSFDGLHGDLSQKLEFFITTDVRASYPTYVYFVHKLQTTCGSYNYCFLFF